MAVNKVAFFGNTIMDISDTTADESSVVAGKQFYKANGESFLIIGRCGDQVLKGNPNMLSIFICGNRQAKVGRVMEKKGLVVAGTRRPAQ